MATKLFDDFDDSFRVDIGPAEWDLHRLQQMRVQGERAIRSLAHRLSETVSLYRSPDVTIFRSEFEGPFWIAYELSPNLMTVHAIQFDPDHLCPIEEAFLVRRNGYIHAFRVPPLDRGPVAWLRAPTAMVARADARFRAETAAEGDWGRTYNLAKLCRSAPLYGAGVFGIDSDMRQLDRAMDAAITLSCARAGHTLAAVEVEGLLFVVDHFSAVMAMTGANAPLCQSRFLNGLARMVIDRRGACADNGAGVYHGAGSP